MKRLTLFFLINFLGMQISSAQIIYHDVNPDSVTYGFPIIMIDDGSGQGMALFIDHTSDVSVRCFTSNYQLMINPVTKYPRKLDAGADINSSQNWSTNFLADDTLNHLNQFGEWISNANDKYLGVRFRVAGNPSFRYGWIRLSIPDASICTIKDWAYNDQTGMSIKAGQNSVTSIVETEVRVKAVIEGKKIQLSGLNESRKVSISIVDLNGRIIRRQNLSNPYSMTTDGIVPGLYMLVIESENTRDILKLQID